jgi:hypothetical protein
MCVNDRLKHFKFGMEGVHIFRDIFFHHPNCRVPWTEVNVKQEHWRNDDKVGGG